MQRGEPEAVHRDGPREAGQRQALQRDQLAHRAQPQGTQPQENEVLRPELHLGLNDIG